MIFRNIVPTLALALLPMLVTSMGPAGGALAQPRAVVELFTSQACSACPRMDDCVTKLADDPSVIALTLPVDYWDYTGWHDTLALNANSRRQRAYAEMRGDHRILTPQAVINGSLVVEGHDRRSLRRILQESEVHNTAPLIPVTVRQEGHDIEVNLPHAHLGEAGAEIWVCPVTTSVTVDITAGENEGRTLTYTNVVRGWVKLADWNGAAMQERVPLAALSLKGADSLAVLVQPRASKSPGSILGAAMIPLTPVPEEEPANISRIGNSLRKTERSYMTPERTRTPSPSASPVALPAGSER
ncbi:DUF1223 domain-containing protein [Xanthobacter sp. TB0139]|uniref:DUF1223 domain-containing protein n=1 Tax=Xanthobacter sp. TB0139 TaxID=3459178 RepID=UPI004039EAD0